MTVPIDLSSLPSIICLDTSFVVTAVVDGIAGHDGAMELCQRLTSAGATVVASEFLRVELPQAAKAVANHPTALRFSVRRRQGLHRWMYRPDARSAWYGRCFESYDRLLSQFVVARELAMTRDNINIAHDLMIELQIDSYDAIHVATALVARAGAIVTRDHHFDAAAAIPGLDVIVVA